MSFVFSTADNMKKNEADFSIRFRHWLKANPTITGAYEMKQTSKDSIPFNALEEHQADYLQAIKSRKGVLIRVQGTNGEPDYIYLRNEPAWIVVKFPAEFCVISIDAWIMEAKRSKRKSLTSERASSISTITVKL